MLYRIYGRVKLNSLITNKVTIVFTEKFGLLTQFVQEMST